MSTVRTSSSALRRPISVRLLANPTIAHRILGAATALTLLANPTDTFFLPDTQGPRPTCGPVAQWTLFCILDSNLELARWLLVIFCIPLVLGILMPLAGILHLYAAFALSLSTLGVEGGDQLCVNVGILLTVYHVLLSAQRYFKSSDTNQALSQFKLVILACVTLQLAFVYFESGVGKMSQQQWQEGTALWYWFQNSAYTGPSVLSDFALILLGFPILSGIISWGTIVFQLCLSLAIFASRNTGVRKFFLISGVLFHIAIWIIFGLPSFGLVMTSCLLLVLGGENFLCKLGDKWIEIISNSWEKMTTLKDKERLK